MSDQTDTTADVRRVAETLRVNLVGAGPAARMAMEMHHTFEQARLQEEANLIAKAVAGLLREQREAAGEKPLYSLAAWNALRRDELTRPGPGTPNGTACPGCEREMVDTQPASIARGVDGLPYRAITCSGCGYHATRCC